MTREEAGMTKRGSGGEEGGSVKRENLPKTYVV